MSEKRHVEYLGGGLELVVSGEHTFGTDALLLAHFAAPKREERCADLGTGCGIIPFYWIREGLLAPVTAVDIQPQAIEQLKESVEKNSLNNRVIPLLADIRDSSAMPAADGFDLVSMNPPYKRAGTGIVSASGSDKIARHETMCTLSDITRAAARLLRYGGRFCMCLRPERLCDTVTAMREARLEPKKLRFVAQRPGTAPWLFLIEGKSGGKSGLTVMPELYIESEETERIIGSYRKECVK